MHEGCEISHRPRLPVSPSSKARTSSQNLCQNSALRLSTILGRCKCCCWHSGTPSWVHGLHLVPIDASATCKCTSTLKLGLWAPALDETMTEARNYRLANYQPYCFRQQQTLTTLFITCHIKLNYVSSAAQMQGIIAAIMIHHQFTIVGTNNADFGKKAL